MILLDSKNWTQENAALSDRASPRRTDRGEMTRAYNNVGDIK
jgi:hypothetical protein